MQTQTRWAQLYKDNELFFVDEHKRIVRLKGDKTERFDLTAELLAKKRFFIQNNRLLMMDYDSQLWFFDLLGGHSTSYSLTALGGEYWRIDDIDLNNDKVLFSVVDSARKEIVLFE